MILISPHPKRKRHGIELKSIRTVFFPVVMYFLFKQEVWTVNIKWLIPLKKGFSNSTAMNHLLLLVSCRGLGHSFSKEHLKLQYVV